MRAKKKERDYDDSFFRKKRESFGTIVFVSDLDMTSEQALQCHDGRWEIELVMRYYKQALESPTRWNTATIPSTEANSSTS